AANPEHLAEIRQSRLGTKDLPLPLLVAFPCPDYTLTIVPGNADPAMKTERLVPNDSPAEAVPGGKANHTLSRARGVPTADLRHDVGYDRSLIPPQPRSANVLRGITIAVAVACVIARHEPVQVLR